jgi:hypothetical protein
VPDADLDFVRAHLAALEILGVLPADRDLELEARAGKSTATGHFIGKCCALPDFSEIEDMPNPQNRSADPAAREMLVRAAELGAKTVWDRHDDLQPLCGFGDWGCAATSATWGRAASIRSASGRRWGACGADAHLIVARNLARAVACGAAAHSDHGREVVEVFRGAAKALHSAIRHLNPEKLRRWRPNGASRGRPTWPPAWRRSSACRNGPLIPRCAPPKSSGGDGRRWASPRAASTAKSSSCCTAPTTAWNRTRWRCCAPPCAPRWPMAGAAP